MSSVPMTRLILLSNLAKEESISLNNEYFSMKKTRKSMCKGREKGLKKQHG